MACLTFVAIGACLRSEAAYSQDQDVAILDYDPSPNAIVLQVSRSSGRTFSGPPNVRVYGDGRVLIYRPSKPMDEQYVQHYLAREEVSSLLVFLYEHGAMEYPYGIVEQRSKEKMLASRKVARDGSFTITPYAVFDGGYIALDVFLRRFRPAKATQIVHDFHHRSGGYAISPLARLMPDVTEVQNLHAIFLRLRELEVKPGMVPASPPTLPTGFVSRGAQPQALSH